MKKTLFAMTVGAGLMYLFHPEHGEARRASLRDKLKSRFPQAHDPMHDKADAVVAKAEDLNTRADSLAAEAVASMGPNVVDSPFPVRTEAERLDSPRDSSAL